VYNTSTTTNALLDNTYGGKTYQDAIRDEVKSKGHTSPASSYPGETFDGVISRWNTLVGSLMFELDDGSTTPAKTWGNEHLTEALKTNERSGHCMWYSYPSSGTKYRYFYVSQE
jgi:hypothetical protein